MIQGKAIEKRTKLNYRQKWSLMLQSRPTLKAQGVQLVGGIMSLHKVEPPITDHDPITNM